MTLIGLDEVVDVTLSPLPVVLRDSKDALEKRPGLLIVEAPARSWVRPKRSSTTDRTSPPRTSVSMAPGRDRAGPVRDGHRVVLS
jgi:hypothetical protein